MSAIEQLIPEGYKHTEVGVIPKDWSVKKLKEISPSQSVGLVINPSSYYTVDGTIPMLVGSQVRENRINWQNANKISPESNKKLPASRLNEGDLVTVRVGEPGVTAVIPPELDKANCASMMIVRKGDKFDSRWLCFLMNSKIGKERIEGVQYGTAQKQFNIVDAIDFLFPFPSKTEQTSIANALSDVDALLTELEKLIAKKQAIKTATMQQLLTGKTRLPQFATYTEGEKKGQPKGTKPSELGEIPEDWDVFTFGMLAQPSNKRVNPQVMGGGDFCIELEHVEQNKGSLRGSTITTESSAMKTAFTKQDVLFGKLRSYLRKYWLADRDGVCSTEIWVLKPQNNLVISPFLYQLVQMDSFIAATSEAYGTHMPRADWNVVKNHFIRVPRIEEQTAIATILSDMDSEIQTLEQHLAKTRQIKQGMMQELLTGKTRLV